MKYIFLSFFIFIAGCGSSTSIDTQEKVTEQTESKKSYKTVRSIEELLKDTSQERTYICVGDSTRSIEDSPRYFERLKSELDKYGINSHLLAKSGYELSEFTHSSRGPNYKRVIDKIPNSGKNTVVDISLSINDLWDYQNQESHKDEIQQRLKNDLILAMNLIKSEKPDTIFLFTSPNPMREWDGGTAIYMEVYKELSNELNIPFVDYYDTTFISLSRSQKNELYRNSGKDNIHYSTTGQLKMANFVLDELGL